MRRYQTFFKSSGFQAQSAIGRRKAELVHTIGLLAFGNLVIIAGLQIASGLPSLQTAGVIFIPFCIAILWALRSNQQGQYLVARWLLIVAFSSAVVIQVLAFHGTDLRTYFYLASTGIAGAVLLPWRHRTATFLFVGANFIAFFWLDAVQLPAHLDVLAAHDNWAIRLLSVWVRVAPFASIAFLFMVMEYLTRRTEWELDALAVIDVFMPIRLTPKALPVVVTALAGQTNPPQRRTHRRSAL
ncbi:hypothetical protein [Rhodoferax ferrireducens]|uniref:hypothetical protein n=1 Tax=Rhodoferax ferrireducens TaxID=192843 RepID=UPI000E0D8304|nr:hypothetical protein [Rhodoferax ferrireducens]